MKEWFDKFAAEFTLNFIKEDRWLQLLKGIYPQKKAYLVYC